MSDFEKQVLDENSILNRAARVSLAVLLLIFSVLVLVKFIGGSL